MELRDTSNVEDSNIENQYRAFLLNGRYPCVMARAMFKMDKYQLKIYDNMDQESSLKKLIEDLHQYIKQYNFNEKGFESFLAVFPNNSFDDEMSFETKLWVTLQKLHELDDFVWDEDVSDDPDDPFFSFSLNGQAFYIIGMHSKSSRMARQTPYTTMVFNLHSQFNKLRQLGSYNKVRDTIRKNDHALQGSINPVLQDLGDESEARQYSGRKIEKEWKCPFHKK